MTLLNMIHLKYKGSSIKWRHAILTILEPSPLWSRCRNKTNDPLPSLGRDVINGLPLNKNQINVFVKLYFLD